MVKKLSITIFVVMTLIAQGFIKQADAASNSSVALDSVLNFSPVSICSPKNSSIISPAKTVLSTALIEDMSASSLSLTPTIPASTVTPTPSPVSIDTPTVTAAPATAIVASITVTSTPTPTPALSVTPAVSLNADVIFSLVNAHRASLGLPAFQKEPRLCELAAARAPEIYNEVYVTGNMHAGLRARALPYTVNENIISINSEQAAVSWWLNSPIHRHAIENNYTYSCVACSGNSCSMVFSNME